jgi:cell fate regulator YaaT (PSP1 superfamily)
LTYEFDTYRKQRKGLPKVGRKLKLDNDIVRVKRQNPLQETILVAGSSGDERVLQKKEWSGAEQVKSDKGSRKDKKKRDDSPANKPTKNEK